MRFHRLELKNLNSLYGHHTIDFDEGLGAPPLFLIRGPTGSGKTTILDAICLALFGTTPRLQHISSVSQRCAKILSDGKGRAHVELDFSLRDGSRRHYYRARWEFWRSRDRPRGTPQNPRRSLCEIDGRGNETAELVNSRTQTTYDTAFDEVLRGLSVDDFFRSVMLAQHQFAAFLKASQEEKASILESLTRTDHYRQIGRLAAEKWSEKKQRLEDQHTRIDALAENVPDDEELEALNESLEELHETKETLEETLEQAKTHRDWLKKDRELEREKKKAADEKKEARKKKEKQKESFETLEKAEAVERGRQPLQVLKGHEAELEALCEDVDELRERRDELDEEVEAKEKRKSTLKKEKQNAEKKLEDARPELKEGRRLAATLESLQKRLSAKTSELEKRKLAKRGLDEKRKKVEERLDRLGDELQQAEEKLEDKEHLEPLTHEFAGLEARVSSRNDEARRLHAQQEELEELSETLHKERNELEELRATLKKQEEKLEPLTEAFEAARNKKKTLCGDAESLRRRRKELRRRRDVLGDELRSLDHCIQSARTLSDHRKKRADCENAVEAMEKHESELHDQIKKREDALETLGGELENLDANIKKLEVAREVHEYRLHLESGDGAECPVCGSKEHPLLAEKSADELHADDKSKLDNLNGERSKLVEKRDKQKQKQTEQKEKLVELATKIETKTGELEKHSEDIAELSAEIAEAAGEIDENLGAKAETMLEAADSPMELFEVARSKRNEDLEGVEEAIDDIDEAEQIFEDRQTKLGEAREQIDELEDEIGTVETKLDERNKEMKRRREALSANIADFVEEFERLAERFDEFGVDLEGSERLRADAEVDVEAVGDRLDAARDEAKEKKEKYEKLKSKVDDKVEERDEAKQALERLDGRIEDAEKEVAKAREDEAELRKEVDSVDEEFEKLVQGRDLDEWEQKLEYDADEANEAFEDIREQLDATRQKLAAAKKAFESNREHIKKRKKKIDEARQQLAEVLEQLPVDDRQALSEALMDLEELEALRNRCRRLDQTLDTAREHLQKVEDKLEAHAEARPETLDDDVTLESAKQKVDELDEQLRSLEGTIGEQKSTLAQGRKQLENLGEARDELERLEEEARPWRKLHELIGKADGKHFKLFAQSLNLGEIIRRANEHLSQLEDRYKLAIKKDENGFPTLEFEIVDRFLAGQRRSLETLSGGETFLVSLALSLALADNRRLDLPIETIFLDEGFGTLDQKALQTAMDCLNQLHARGGRTVGVISHVEALHRDGGIAHQVVLETVREGVSKIRIDRPTSP